MDQNHCGRSVGSIKDTDFALTEDALIFAELLEVPLMALEALREEARQLCFKIQVY